MSRCYIGNLPTHVEPSDILKKFDRISKVLDVNIKKTVSDDSYAFIHFADKDGAEIAVRELDDCEILGRRVRVELPLEKRPREERRGSRYFGIRRRRDKGPRFPIHISGLPPSGSWQDLKDHFREAGECAYADVGPGGSGVVEYTSLEDARHALRVCKGLTFTSHEGETAKIKLELVSESTPYEKERDYRGREDRRGSSRRRRERSPPPRYERYTTHDSNDNYSGMNISPRERRRDLRADPSDSFDN